MTLAASANSVRYFTRPQATRVANALDAQAELMIYCGYEYELATYVIINEVWAEPVNSKYYEIWVYGYDAYTGEEIYMPIDLSCIWLYNSMGNRMYSAAQYLRFRSTVATPNFYWTMPPYNPYIRYYHDPAFNRLYTYHYEIHRYGWRPPAPSHGAPAPYHPYYMRTPHTPATVPTKPFTPGVDHPTGNGSYNNLGNARGNTNRSTALNNRGGVRTGNNRSNSGNPGVTSRSSSSSDVNTNRGSSSTTGTTNRGSSTTTGTTNRGNSSTTGTTNRGNSSTTGTTNRGNSTTTGTTNRGSSSTTGTTNRGSSATTGTTNRSNNTNRGSSATTGTTNRGSSTIRNTTGNDTKNRTTQNGSRNTSNGRSGR